MKKLNLVAVLLSTCFLLNSQNSIDQFFEKYQLDDRFTSVLLTPKLFEIASKAAPEDLDPEVKDVIAQIEQVRVLTTDDGESAYYEEAMQSINSDDFEDLVTVRSDEENVRIMIKSSKDSETISEGIVLVSGGEFVFVHFSGAFNLADISKMIHRKDWDLGHGLSNLGDDDMNAELLDIETDDLRKSGINLENDLKIEDIEVYPNPNQGLFKLKFDSPESGHTLVNVYNNTGQLIYSQNIGIDKGSNSEDLDLMTPEPGLYYLVIRQNDKSFSRKILISAN